MTLSPELLKAFAEDNLELKFRRAYEEAAPEAAAAQALDAELAGVKRRDLTPKQTSDLIDRVGYERYMQIPWDDQPRDELGRYRVR
jgi:hypothetical protein